jgi:basic membrane protein A
VTRRLIVVAMVGWSVLAATGCRRASYAADDRARTHVGIVFDIGGKDDRSFNAAAWAGVKCAESGTLPDGRPCGKPPLGIVVRDVEPGTPNAIEPAMRAFAERGYDLVIGVGFAQAPIMRIVARDYPNIRFAIIDGVVLEDDGKTPLPNVAGLLFKEHEGSYLVGMIAARTSRTGTVGFVGGMDIPLIRRFEKGYEEGARAANPRIQVVQNYVGVTDAAWNNPGKGRSSHSRRWTKARMSSSPPPATRVSARSMRSSRPEPKTDAPRISSSVSIRTRTASSPVSC